MLDACREAFQDAPTTDVSKIIVIGGTFFWVMPHKKKITWRNMVQALITSDDWSKVLNASVRRGIKSSAADKDEDRMVRATRGGTTITRLLLILICESAGATNANTSALEEAPLRFPHVGQGVSSTSSLNEDG